MKSYVDTNILLRLATNDAPVLARKALFSLEASRQNYTVLEMVVAEFVFVLESKQYGFNREEVFQQYKFLKRLKRFIFPDKLDATFSYYLTHRRLSFVDCYILATARSNTLLTQDKHLEKLANL